MSYKQEDADKILKRMQRSFEKAYIHESGIALDHANGTTELVYHINQQAFKDFTEGGETPEPEVDPVITWSKNFDQELIINGDKLVIGLGSDENMDKLTFTINGTSSTPTKGEEYTLTHIENNGNGKLDVVALKDGEEFDKVSYTYSSFTPPTASKIKESITPEFGKPLTLTVSFTGAKVNGTASNGSVTPIWSTTNTKNETFNGSTALKLEFTDLTEEDNGKYVAGCTYEGLEGTVSMDNMIVDFDVNVKKPEEIEPPVDE